MGNEVVNVKDLKREIEEIYEKYLMKGIFYYPQNTRIC